MVPWIASLQNWTDRMAQDWWIWCLLSLMSLRMQNLGWNAINEKQGTVAMISGNGGGQQTQG